MNPTGLLSDDGFRPSCSREECYFFFLAAFLAGFFAAFFAFLAMVLLLVVGLLVAFFCLTADPARLAVALRAADLAAPFPRTFVGAAALAAAARFSSTAAWAAARRATGTR